MARERALVSTPAARRKEALACREAGYICRKEACVPRTKLASDSAVQELREFGLRYPGAEIASPWPEHRDLVVNHKTFAFMSVEGLPFSMSCKLPHSGTAALMFEFAEPARYGLGKSGWVTVKFGARQRPPVELLKAWIDESYRAQAPKKLVAALGAGAAQPLPAASDSKTKPRKKAAAVKAARVARAKP
jgi:predicted DNA-binding protein (MmcQ/YjbR family)